MNDSPMNDSPINDRPINDRQDQPQPQRHAVIRTVMMPRDTNPMGTIFGGHILSLIDLAAGEHAREIAPKTFVTKVMREVEFHAPVYVGDRLSFYTETVKIGRTSITVRIEVETLGYNRSGPPVSVTSAECVMVAVDENRKPIPIRE